MLIVSKDSRWIRKPELESLDILEALSTSPLALIVRLLPLFPLIYEEKQQLSQCQLSSLTSRSKAYADQQKTSVIPVFISADVFCSIYLKDILLVCRMFLFVCLFSLDQPHSTPKGTAYRKKKPQHLGNLLQVHTKCHLHYLVF